MFDLVTMFSETILKAWGSGGRTLRIVIISAAIFLSIGLSVIWLSNSNVFYSRDASAFGTVVSLFGGIVLLLIGAREKVREQEKREERIELIEERARDNPKQTQLAWDLARTKLENYLDRNLGQLRSIFWLTSFVMIAGFGFVSYGLIKAYENPTAFPITVVSSVSGVLISFIGGSFLLIYRSILTQTRRYVAVLERINAVGMAVQVLDSISDGGEALRDKSVAALAKQLIDLYSKSSLNELKD